MLRRISGLVAALLALGLLASAEAAAQWAANPGDTVRNGFGALKDQHASVCRGACGLDCPESCDADVQFECVGADRLLRVRSFSCGTHQGCREHDDCLDRCTQQNAAGHDCAAECHAEAVTDWGLEQASMWAVGGGQFDAEPIHFQYSQDTPGGPEANYRCPAGSQRQCTSGQGTCLNGKQEVEPLFDSFLGGTGSVRVSGFRSGPVCTQGGNPDSVCAVAVDIHVTGEDRCTQAGGAQACTWYGFEFDYRDANPNEPLFCRSTGAGEEDFLGGIVSAAIESAPPAEPDDDLGRMLGHFQKELQSGKSLDQVFSGITVTTADGQTLGGAPQGETFPEPGVPSEVSLEGRSGRVLVPMFELRGASPAGSLVERQVVCSQAGQPLIETTFRLHF